MAAGPESQLPVADAGRALGRPGRSFYARVVKRLCDIGLSVIGLPVIGLHLLIFAPLIRREDKGPVFYNATRIGQDGRPFKMYKYRTMHMDAPDLKEADGSTYNAPDDPRLTRIGAFLRRTSMDEFPQLLNVLKGEMSFIGPRPDLAEEVNLYQGEESQKLQVKPGISGYAQVFGRNAIPWHDRLALDLRYVRHQSFLLDTRIFFRTFAAVFSQKDVYETSGEGREGKQGSGESVSGEDGQEGD
jgi:lipopolysaccharide/colanic/teichoic acid biosynthesis glycosyltransferase